MSIKYKIMLILGLCTIMSIGSFFIINKIFGNLENQLLEKCEIEALTGAKVMSETIELLIETNIVNEKDVFDTNYIKIAGSNPQKFHTKYDGKFDKYIQKIEDEFLLDVDVDFAILIDKNGYVPTHNSKYSLPETSDKRKNLKYSRTKRNFSNFPAIKKAISYKGDKTITLFYNRDTGQKMLNIAAPIKIKNKHWGSFLIGVSLDRINTIKNQMTILIVTVMFIFLSLTILILIGVMPKKFFSSDMDIPKY